MPKPCTKKMGRPATGVRRPHRVVVSYSDDELEEINAACGANRDEWIRKITLATAKRTSAA